MNLNVRILIYIFNYADDEMHKYSFIVFPCGEIQKKNIYFCNMERIKCFL